MIEHVKEDRLLIDSNATSTEYPLHLCLHELIENTIEQHTHKTAVLFAGEHLTYHQLNQQSNQLAHYLREVGVGPNHIVAVVMERSIEMIVTLLAILKAGGAYLPIDPSYPEERINFMLQDAAVTIVCVQQKYNSLFTHFCGTVAVVDDSPSYLRRMPITNLNNITKPEDLAYVIYTSGSTGKPKGCMLSHKAICNRLLWMKEKYSIDCNDKILQKTPFTFDVSVWEFFLPLISGASLVVARPNGHKDNVYLIELITNQKVTICHFVPSMLRYFLNQTKVATCVSLQHVFVSGEALSFDLLQQFKKIFPAKLHNLYGPTEAAVDVTYWEAEERDDQVVPIGMPIANVQLYILDSELRMVPIGSTGELCIAGVGLAKGYINQPQLTNEKFVQNPFSNDTTAKLYKTGDRARYLPDGNIEFLGRLDFQVKLRGFRIELAEIESLLREHSDIQNAVVLVQDSDTQDPKLVAYILTNNKITTANIKDFLKQKLPEWMIPNFILPLEAIPLTTHGKIDRKALPWPIQIDTLESSIAPLKDTKLLVHQQDNQVDSELLEDVLGSVIKLLGVSNLTIEDDLFDCGATSFTMVQIVASIQEKYNVTIPVEVFLDNPTVKALVAYLEQNLSSLRSDKHIQTEPKYESDTKHTIKLESVNFSEAIYQKNFNNLEETISLENFGKFLSLLKKRDNNVKPQYLYSSAGGLHPIQTYIYVRKNAIEGLDDGIYYYHPIEHSLYIIAPSVNIESSILAKQNHDITNKANFVIFFISQLATIRPIYSNLSPILSILEAGYMAQLLINRQDDFGLKLSPTLINFDLISNYFKLDHDQMYVHCLFGNTNNEDELDKYNRKKAHSTTLSTQTATESTDNNDFINNKYAALLKVKIEDLHFPSESSKDSLTANSNLRQFSANNIPIKLAYENLDSIYYHINSAKREYIDKQITFKQFSQFLSLLQRNIINNQELCLYPLITGNQHIKVYLYIKENAIETIEEGIYYYDADAHQLISISNEPLVHSIKSSYTPYNRNHFTQAKFCLYLIAEQKALKEVYGELSTYLALLESGHIGQLLLDKQAEFTMGVCPIGTMRFDKIRTYFGLKNDDELVHSFICGPVEQSLPEDWKYLLKQPPQLPNTINHNQYQKQVVTKHSHDIAIIGVSGRYPGAADINEYAENLKSGKVSFKELKFNEDGQYRINGLKQNTRNTTTHLAGFIDDIDCFDYNLFHIPYDEAKNLDPQERMTLEVVWECLENAGYTNQELSKVANNVGVFIGAMWDDYQHYAEHSSMTTKENAVISHHSSIANHISHYFNFTGPSIAINTSCSSSMTALHLACNSIKLGECKAAIIGGVNIMSHPFHYELLRQLDLLSKDGKCYPFGMNGSGWVPGEGVGAILIKSLEDAKNDKDHIYALIKGTNIGHYGKTIRYGSPSSNMQKTTILGTLTKANVAAESINYIEAAAPGACIADASEITAVKEIFAQDATRDTTVYIGSVKSNIGHLESAAGLSQLTKVLLQLQYQCIFPTVHVNNLNPMIQLEGSTIKIADQLTEWQPITKNDDCVKESPYLPRRALINAFGATGTSGCAIIEEYRQDDAYVNGTKQEHLFIFSAATRQQLKQLIEKFYKYLCAFSNLIRLEDMSYTLQVGRKEMEARLAVVASSHNQLQEMLYDYLQDRANIPNLYTGNATAHLQQENMIDANSSFSMLARKWVDGEKVSWQILHHGYERRIPLPTYPFAKLRCWITNSAAEEHQSSKVADEQLLQLENSVTPGNVVITNGNGSHNENLNGSEQNAENKAKENTILFLQELVAKQLGMSEYDIDINLDYFALGLTSSDILCLSAALQEKISFEILPNIFFDYPTILSLASYLAPKYPNSLKQLVKKRDQLQRVYSSGNATNDIPTAINNSHNQVLKILQQLKNGAISLDVAINLID